MRRFKVLPFLLSLIPVFACVGCTPRLNSQATSTVPAQAPSTTSQAPSTSPVQDITSIAQAYAEYFPIGAAIQPDMTMGMNAEILKKHFNSVVAETRMKWEPTEPAENKFTFTDSDLIVNFAKANNMKVRGHTLVWHTAVPAWVFQDTNGQKMTEPTEANKALLRQRLENHIKNVVTHFGDNVYAWDVVNEAIDESVPDGFRKSPWYQILGTEYIDLAFIYAHKYAPNAKLYYNDYGTWEWANPRHYQLVYNLVKDLKSRGIPIDGVGHQSHMSIYTDTTGLAQKLESFASLGLDNQITELDVSVYQTKTSPGYTTLSQDVAMKQADQYRTLFNILKQEKTKARLTGVTLWGVADNHSWLTTKSRKDFPLLFDDRFQAKPAYWGVVDPQT